MVWRFDEGTKTVDVNWPFPIAEIFPGIPANLDAAFRYKDGKFALYLSAFHAAGECRRQVIDVTNFVKNVNIMEFHGHIWNHHEKCIQICTNMPCIGVVIPEINL